MRAEIQDRQHNEECSDEADKLMVAMHCELELVKAEPDWPMRDTRRSRVSRAASCEPGGIRTHDQGIKSPLLYR